MIKDLYDFQGRMMSKLHRKTMEGWSGWDDLSVEECKQRLINHIEKGDFVDVANFAFFADYNACNTMADNSDEVDK